MKCAFPKPQTMPGQALVFSEIWRILPIARRLLLSSNLAIQPPLWGQMFPAEKVMPRAKTASNPINQKSPGRLDRAQRINQKFEVLEINRHRYAFPYPCEGRVDEYERGSLGTARREGPEGFVAQIPRNPRRCAAWPALTL